MGDLHWSFVYPEFWHFHNDATSKIDDVLTEHGKLVVGGLLGFGDSRYPPLYISLLDLKKVLRNC